LTVGRRVGRGSTIPKYAPGAIVSADRVLEEEHYDNFSWTGALQNAFAGRRRRQHQPDSYRWNETGQPTTLLAMATAGLHWNMSMVVPSPPQTVATAIPQAVPQGGNYFDQYEVRSPGFGSIQIVRQFVPTWAIVLAIIGALFFLIGLLLLLLRTTEILQVTVYENSGGSRVDVNGVASSRLGNQLQAALNHMAQFGVAQAPMPTAPGAVGLISSPNPVVGTTPSTGTVVNCSYCGAGQTPGARFCSQCGRDPVPRCPNGHPVQADWNFCKECSTPLPSS